MMNLGLLEKILVLLPARLSECDQNVSLDPRTGSLTVKAGTAPSSSSSSSSSTSAPTASEGGDSSNGEN